MYLFCAFYMFCSNDLLEFLHRGIGQKLLKKSKSNNSIYLFLMHPKDSLVHSKTGLFSSVCYKIRQRRFKRIFQDFFGSYLSCLSYKLLEILYANSTIRWSQKGYSIFYWIRQILIGLYKCRFFNQKVIAFNRFKPSKGFSPSGK